MAHITCKLTHDEMTTIIRQHFNLPNDAVVDIIDTAVELVDADGWVEMEAEYDFSRPPTSASKHDRIAVQFEDGSICVGSPYDWDFSWNQENHNTIVRFRKE